jgi:hypothetical protein
MTLRALRILGKASAANAATRGRSASFDDPLSQIRQIPERREPTSGGGGGGGGGNRFIFCGFEHDASSSYGGLDGNVR